MIGESRPGGTAPAQAPAGTGAPAGRGARGGRSSIVHCRVNAIAPVGGRGAGHAGANIGTGGPPSEGLNTTRTFCPIRTASRSQSTMLVSIETPSSSVT